METDASSYAKLTSLSPNWPITVRGGAVKSCFRSRALSKLARHNQWEYAVRTLTVEMSSTTSVSFNFFYLRFGFRLSSSSAVLDTLSPQLICSIAASNLVSTGEPLISKLNLFGLVKEIITSTQTE